MEASTSNGSDDVKTFRGRSLEELLPQIRAELGPDAIVLRRREGLGGGVGGFFQRPYVEVDARAPQSGERPLEIRSDRATIEGLSSPAVQALFEQATPFADALAAAARETRTEEDTFSAAMFGGEGTRQAAPPPHPDHPTSRAAPRRETRVHALRRPVRRAIGLRPLRPAAERRGDRRAAKPRRPARLAAAGSDRAPRGRDAAASAAAAGASRRAPARRRSTPAARTAPLAAGAAWVRTRRAAPRRARRRRSRSRPRRSSRSSRPPGRRPPEAADAAEQRLVAAGLSPALAADVVGEAVVHGLPFSAPRNLKKLIRAALARRIPVLTAARARPAHDRLHRRRRRRQVLGGRPPRRGLRQRRRRRRGDRAARRRRRSPTACSRSASASSPPTTPTQAKQRLGARKPLVTLIDTPAAGAEHVGRATSRRWPPT